MANCELQPPDPAFNILLSYEVLRAALCCNTADDSHFVLCQTKVLLQKLDLRLLFLQRYLGLVLFVSVSHQQSL